jgi:flavin-dependent dehydrogenase
MIALRAYIHGLALNPHEVELYFRKEVLPGYVWIFPLNETRANIGLGMMMDRYRKIRKNLKEILFEFLEREMKHRLKNGWKLNDISAAPLKLASQPGIKRVYNGAILVGDAAALIDPLSGEGILNALHSGKIAGEVIHNAISHGDVTERALSEYDNRLRKELWGIIRRSYLLQKTLFASPKLIDWLLKGISKNSFILNIANDFSVDFTYEPMESD